MFQKRRGWLLGLLAGVLAAAMVFPAYGSKRSPIKSITFSIKANILPDTEYGEEEIELETNSNRFSIDGYEVLNEGFGWSEDSLPRLRVTMTAGDDYYFTSLSKDKVTIKGGAEFVKATRQDSNSTLLMEIKLPSLGVTLRELEDVTLSDNGIASWDEIKTAEKQQCLRILSLHIEVLPHHRSHRLLFYGVVVIVLFHFYRITLSCKFSNLQENSNLQKIDGNWLSTNFLSTPFMRSERYRFLKLAVDSIILQEEDSTGDKIQLREWVPIGKSQEENVYEAAEIVSTMMVTGIL